MKAECRCLLVDVYVVGRSGAGGIQVIGSGTVFRCVLKVCCLLVDVYVVGRS